MNAETNANNEPAKVRVTQYKARVGEFVDSRRGKMFGIAEVAGIAGSCLILLLVMLSYLYFLVPARSRVAALSSDNKQLKTNLETLQGVNRKEQSTTATVNEITTSLGKFETDFLPRQDLGRMELYEELNQLIIKNGVRNTSGPTYTELEPEGTKSTGGRMSLRGGRVFIPALRS